MKTLVLVLALALSGCAVPLRTLNVPIAVRCKEPTPARPNMPTETVATAASIDTKTRAALAEIELREAYEDQLRTALKACQ